MTTGRINQVAILIADAVLDDASDRSTGCASRLAAYTSQPSFSFTTVTVRTAETGARDRRISLPYAVRALVSRSESTGPSRYRYHTATRPTCHLGPHPLLVSGPPRCRGRTSPRDDVSRPGTDFHATKGGKRLSQRPSWAIPDMAQRRRDDLLRIRVHHPPSVVFRSDTHPP